MWHWKLLNIQLCHHRHLLRYKLLLFFDSIFQYYCLYWILIYKNGALVNFKDFLKILPTWTNIFDLFCNWRGFNRAPAQFNPCCGLSVGCTPFCITISVCVCVYTSACGVMWDINRTSVSVPWSHCIPLNTAASRKPDLWSWCAQGQGQ